MSDEWTKGPWFSDGIYVQDVKPPAISYTIADCGKSTRIDAREKIANARLIAAAPQLIEALDQIAAIENKDFGPDWEEIEEARAIANEAIKLVRGE
jgi:hypothetical protein